MLGMVFGAPEERLFNRLLEQSHYLRHQQPVGEHLKYPIHYSARRAAVTLR
jgi:hypothetical protein